MAAPVIRPETSIWTLFTGQPFGFTPAVTSGTPTSWSALGLPEGITINTTTGFVSGVPTRPGVYSVTLKCTNAGSETSTGVIIAAGVQSQVTSSVGAVDLEVDLDTKVVWNERITTDTPVLFAKTGDKILVSVGIRKNGVLQDVGVAAVKVHLRASNDDSTLTITEAFTKLGSYDNTRYLLRLDFSTTAAKALLDQYETFDNIAGAPGVHAFPQLEFQFTLETISGVTSTFSPFTTRTFLAWYSKEMA